MMKSFTRIHTVLSTSGAGTAHPVAAVVEEAASQNGGRTPELYVPGDGVGGALGLHGFGQIAGEDRLMRAGRSSFWLCLCYKPLHRRGQ
jgi:hypothetical protein